MSARDENIRGGRELDDLLQTLPVKVEKNILRGAMRAGAKVMLAEVKQRIPVASGQLAASARITTRASKGRVSASVKVGNIVAWYAHLVEFGTRAHTIKPKERGGALRFGGVTTGEVHHPGIAPRPFMRPAADSGMSAALAAVTAKVRERLTAQGLNSPEPLPPDDAE